MRSVCRLYALYMYALYCFMHLVYRLYALYALSASFAYVNCALHMRFPVFYPLHSSFVCVRCMRSVYRFYALHALRVSFLRAACTPRIIYMRCMRSMRRLYALRGLFVCAVCAPCVPSMRVVGGAVLSGAESERVRSPLPSHLVRRRKLFLPAKRARDGSQVLPGMDDGFPGRKGGG